MNTNNSSIKKEVKKRKERPVIPKLAIKNRTGILNADLSCLKEGLQLKNSSFKTRNFGKTPRVMTQRNKKRKTLTGRRKNLRKSLGTDSLVEMKLKQDFETFEKNFQNF